VPDAVTGRSLFPQLVDAKPVGRMSLVLARERHANVRKGDLSYPARAIRTKDWLYIRNLRPDLWPAGDPEKHVAVGPFGDCDDGPSKQVILARRDGDLARFFRLGFEKRPAVELYDLKNDPWQLEDVAAKNPGVAGDLDRALLEYLAKTGDPRMKDGTLTGDDVRWDKFPYYGK
jgi:N-sulfoglucosamine sulfohydrolase